MPNPTTLIPEGVRVLTEPDTPRERWLELRRTGIGGSDALAVAGLDPWRSPLGVWLEKTGSPNAPQVAETPVMRWGNLLEQPLAEWFTKSTGIEVYECGMLGHPMIEWQLYTPDRLAEDDALVEFKTTNPWNSDEWSNGKVSDRAELQVQHGMAVTGKSKAYVVVGIWGEDPQMRVVQRDERLIEDLTRIEAAFWDLVQSQIPPPLTGHATDADLMAQLHPQADGSCIELSQRAYDALVGYKNLGEQIKQLEATREALQARVTAELCSASDGTWQGRTVVTWRNTAGLDQQMLAELYPDLAKQYEVVKTGIDTKALYADHPELVSPLRARRFLPANKI